MELMQAIKDRRSVRDYTDEPVSREEILSLIEAAAASPASSNASISAALSAIGPATATAGS